MSPAATETSHERRPLRRLGQLSLAAVVTLGVSFWQVILFAVTPASARPYADGSTNNSLLSMIFEYNLSTRFGAGSDSVSFGPAGGGGGFGGARGGGPGGGGSAWGYMFSDQVAPQVGWVCPLALAGLILGLFGCRLAGKWSPSRWGGRTDIVRAGTLMWGTWLLVHGIAFSAGRVAHSFYVVAVAPPLAAGGLFTLWRLYRRGGWGHLAAARRDSRQRRLGAASKLPRFLTRRAGLRRYRPSSRSTATPGALRRTTEIG